MPNTRIRQAATALLAVAVFGFAWFLRYNDPNGSFAGLTDDHFFYVVRGWQILFGDLPVRDFVDHGAPGYFYVSAAVQMLFGRGTASELIFSTTVLSLGAALTFWIATTASGSILWGLVGAMFHVFLAPRFYNYPKVLVYAIAIPLIWRFADRPGIRRIVPIAVITVVGFLLRHDHGVFVGVAMLTMLLILRSVPWRERVGYAVVYGVLTLVVVSPYLAFIQWHGGLVQYFRGASAWAERDRGRAEVEWPGLFDNPDGVSPAASSVNPLTRVRAVYHDNQDAWLYYMLIALPVLSGAALVFGRDGFRPEWPHAAEKIVTVAVLGEVLNAGFLRHPIGGRLADPSVPHAVLVAWLGAAVSHAWRHRDVLRPAWRSRPWAARAGVTLVAMVPLLITAALLSDDTYRRLDKSSLVEGFDKAVERAGYITDSVKRAWPVDPSIEQHGTLQLSAYLRACTAPTDRVLVEPYLPQVAAMADRAFAGGHADFRAGLFDTEADQRLTLSRLQRQSVPVALFEEGEMPGVRESLPLIVRYLDQHYVQAGVHQFDQWHIVLFVDRNRRAVRTWTPLGWPCFQ